MRSSSGAWTRPSASCAVLPDLPWTRCLWRSSALTVSTSKPQVLAEELLRREGLLELFDCVCGAAEEGEGNAKWQVLRRAMGLLDADPACSALVGDTKYDVAGALRCGIPCIGVGYGYAAEGELEQAGAAAIAPDLASLRELLLN